MLKFLLVIDTLDNFLVNHVADSLNSVVVSADINSTTDNSLKSLTFLLVLNIILIVLNFILDLCKSKKENHNYKIRKISEKAIDCEEKVYSELLRLSMFNKNENHDMLDSITNVSEFVRKNKLYIGKQFYKIVEEFLDYYMSVLVDYSKKDIKKEEAYIDKLCNKFYGQ